MSNVDAPKESNLPVVKSEPIEVNDADMKVEPADEPETSDNNNTLPALTTLLNQPPAAEPERQENGKGSSGENYMKLLNLKLSELAPMPIDVVRVKLDIDGDINFELSIDEGSDGEKEAENDKKDEPADVARAKRNRDAAKNPDGPVKPKLSPVRKLPADKTSSVPKSAKLDQPQKEVSIISKFLINPSKDDEGHKDESDSRKYTCLRCGFITVVDEDLRKHMLKWHEGELGIEGPRFIRKKMGTKYYPCDKCDQHFPTHRLLQYHRATHKLAKVFVCGKCDQMFPSFEVLKKHQFEDQGGCLNAYRFSSNASEPEQKSDQEREKIVAERCANPSLANNHLKSVNEKGESTYFCQYFLSCGFKTNENEQLVDHMKSAHGGSSKHPFSCDKCSYKDYQYSNYTAHQKQHQGDDSLPTKVVCKTVWIPTGATSDPLTTEGDDHSRSSDSSTVEPPSKKSKTANPVDVSDTPSSVEPPPAETKKNRPGTKPYSCLRCNVKYKGADGLRKHMKKHQEEDDFLNSKLLAASASGDLQSVEMEEEMDPLAGPLVPLPPECQALLDAGVKILKKRKMPESGKVNVVHLVHGAVSSSEEKSREIGMSFPCDTCKSEFSTLLELKNHEILKHSVITNKTPSEPSVSYPCETCKSVFPTFTGLKNHEMLKHGIKTNKTPPEPLKQQFLCTKCKYRTREEVLLKRHYLKRHATSAIPKKSLQKKAASLVRMVSAGSKVKVACDSTTMDDELKL